MSPRTGGPAAPAARTAAVGGTLALILVTALAPMAWGTTYAVTTEFLPPDHPLFAGLLRSLPGGLLLLLVTRVLPSGAWWWKAAVLGVLNIGAFYPLLFLTAELLPGGVAATLGAVQPLIVAGLAVTVMRERPSLWRIGWAVAGAAGVGMVVLGPSAGLGLAGVGAGLLGTASMALGVVLTKHWKAPAGVGPMAMTGWQLTAGGLFLVPLTFLFEGAPPRIDGSAVLGYLWLGTVGGFIAHTLWLRGIRRLPVTATALLILLSPLVAAVIGAFVLDESFTGVQTVGLTLALGALVAGQLSPRRRTAQGA